MNRLSDLHSTLNATTGSTRAARRAGNQVAIAATVTTTMATAVAIGTMFRSPGIPTCDMMILMAAALSGKPMAMPMKLRRSPPLQFRFAVFVELRLGKSGTGREWNVQGREMIGCDVVERRGKQVFGSFAEIDDRTARHDTGATGKRGRLTVLHQLRIRQRARAV